MATLKTLNGQDVISGSGRTVYPDTKGNNIYQGKVKPKQEYYTCAQGKVYINEILLDEAYDIMYSYRELKEPIYGYNSKYYDAIVPGTVIIYGSFTINYKHDSYLAKTLAKTELKGVGSSLSDNELKRLFEKKNEAEKKARDYLRDVSLVKASLGSRQEKEIELALLSKEKEAFEKEKLAAEEAYGDTLRKYAEEQDRVAADKKKFIEDLKNSDIESYGKLNKANQELSEARIEREGAKNGATVKQLSTGQNEANAKLKSLNDKLAIINKEIKALESKISKNKTTIKKGKSSVDSLGQTIIIPLNEAEKKKLEAENLEYELSKKKRLYIISDSLEPQIEEQEEILEQLKDQAEDDIKDAQAKYEDRTDEIAELREDNPNLVAYDNYNQGEARYKDLITNLTQAENKRKEDANKRKTELENKEKKLKQDLETINASITTRIQEAANNKTISRKIDEEMSGYTGQNTEGIDKYYDPKTHATGVSRAEDSKEKFNLLLEYSGSVHKIIEGCTLTGHVHAIQQGGDNIKEQYSFIGRLIR